jgi:hypothetical protein
MSKRTIIVSLLVLFAITVSFVTGICLGTRLRFREEPQVFDIQIESATIKRLENKESQVEIGFVSPREGFITIVVCEEDKCRVENYFPGQYPLVQAHTEYRLRPVTYTGKAVILILQTQTVAYCDVAAKFILDKCSREEYQKAIDQSLRGFFESGHTWAGVGVVKFE